MTTEGPSKFAEKFNFSGEIENSDFNVTELATNGLGYKEVVVGLGNDETGRESINGLFKIMPSETDLSNVNIRISHNAGNACPTEMMIEGYSGCNILITNTGGPDQAYILYVKEDLEKLKGILHA